ncbi:unnamed protein product, partial [Didymodactylos carnosus]
MCMIYNLFDTFLIVAHSTSGNDFFDQLTSPLHLDPLTVAKNHGVERDSRFTVLITPPVLNPLSTLTSVSRYATATRKLNFSLPSGSAFGPCDYEGIERITLNDGNIVKLIYAHKRLKFGGKSTSLRAFTNHLQKMGHFQLYTLSRREGTYVLLSNISIYLKLLLKNALGDDIIKIVLPSCETAIPAIPALQQNQEGDDYQLIDKVIIKTVATIRDQIKLMNNNNSNNPVNRYGQASNLKTLTPDEYEQQLPKLLLNFIILCTMNNDEYDQFLYND